MSGPFPFWDRRLRAIGVLCVLLAIVVGASKDCARSLPAGQHTGRLSYWYIRRD